MKNKAIFLATAVIVFLFCLAGCKPTAPENVTDLNHADTADIAVSEEISDPEEIAVYDIEMDDYACALSDGYKWCEEKKKCIKESEEECEKAEDYVEPKGSYFLIKDALADKYGKSPDDFTLGIKKLTLTHFLGVVSGKEGVVLAVKRNNDWIIVFDNVFSEGKIYACDDADKYHFPSDMMIDCAN